MRCLGRTKNARRCKNEALSRYAFCRQHRFQPWLAFFAVVSVLGVFFGLYRDAIEPLFQSQAARDKAVLMKQLCGTTHGIVESLDAISSQAHIRQEEGRSPARDTLDRQLADIVSQAYQTGDESLIAAARDTRASFYAFFEAPIDRYNEKLMVRRFELGALAWGHLHRIEQVCRTRGFYDFPSSLNRSQTTPEIARRTKEYVLRFLRSTEVKSQLEPTEPYLDKWTSLVTSNAGVAIELYLKSECDTRPQELAAKYNMDCKSVVGRPFAIISIEEYYRGGLAFSIVIDNPHSDTFILWWRDPEGILGAEYMPLSDGDRKQLGWHFAKLFDVARVAWRDFHEELNSP